MVASHLLRINPTNKTEKNKPEMWNPSYLIALNHEYLKEVQLFQKFEYNEERCTLTGYSSDEGKQHCYKLKWLPDKWSNEMYRSYGKADIIFGLLKRPHSPTLEEWCFTYLLRKHIESNLSCWTYSNNRVAYLYKGEKMEIALLENSPLHNPETLTAIEALVCGYTFSEVPGSHYEISREDTIPVATTPWSCTCSESNKSRSQEKCVHLCLVRTLLNYRVSRLEV